MPDNSEFHFWVFAFEGAPNIPGSSIDGTPIKVKISAVPSVGEEPNAAPPIVRAVNAKEVDTDPVTFVESRAFLSQDDAEAWVTSGIGLACYEHCANCVLYRVSAG